MPNIKPISDLRNYTDVLREVRDNNPVYLTRNGRGEYAIVKIGELDRLRASVALMAQLEDGEKSAR
ncbi:type II toxin-antitoxin system prevent-host-death family antitoxin, partial [Hungatella effluvii]